jgi:hypothetical protein
MTLDHVAYTIKTTLRTTLILAITLFLALWGFSQFPFGLGILIGCSWGCVNLLLIKHLVESFFSSPKPSQWKHYFLLGLKFPMLYFIGYLLLKTDFMPIYALVTGFSLLLAISMGVGAISLNKRKMCPKNTAAEN